MDTTELLEELDEAVGTDPSATVWVLERNEAATMDDDDAFMGYAVVAVEVDDDEESVELSSDPDDALPALTVAEVAAALRVLGPKREGYQVFGRLHVRLDEENAMAYDYPIVGTQLGEGEFWAALWFENFEAELV